MLHEWYTDVSLMLVIQRLSMSVVLSYHTFLPLHSVLSESSCLPLPCLLNTSLSNISWRSKEGVVTLERLYPSPCKSVVLRFEVITFSLYRTIQWDDSISFFSVVCHWKRFQCLSNVVIDLVGLILMWKGNKSEAIAFIFRNSVYSVVHLFRCDMPK